jgi:hypothetical protein
VGIGDDGGIDLRMPVWLELLELERDTVVRIELVEPRADV